MKRLLLIPLFILLLPLQGQEAKNAVQSTPSEVHQLVPVREPLSALTEYKETLVSRGQDLSNQGVLVETLNGGTELAGHNADVPFNPASVMKLATTLVALNTFAPDHRYRTNFLADGVMNTAEGKLEGDLVVEGGFDPMFSSQDAESVARELSRLRITRVMGNLRVAGPFYYYARGYTSNLSRETSAAKLRGILERSGIKINGSTIFGEPSGNILLSHYSERLDNILLYQNAFSSNAVAEVVGESFGGPQAVQSYLVKQLGVSASDLYVGHTSGLDYNRITARGAIKVLRSLIRTIDEYGLKPEDILPVAGIDSGTLRARLHKEEIRGAVLAKTGTLVSFDNGVSTLVGVVYTKREGPVLFAIFNSSGNVNQYRRLQDQFVEQILSEEGGPVPVPRLEDAINPETREPINQVLYSKTGGGANAESRGGEVQTSE